MWKALLFTKNCLRKHENALLLLIIFYLNVQGRRKLPSSKWVGKTKNYSTGSKKWVGKYTSFDNGLVKKWVPILPTHLRRPWRMIHISIFSILQNISSIFFFLSAQNLMINDSSDVFLVNRSILVVEQTELRKNIQYVEYYILLTNFIFMGIIPSIIMIIFNVLVVRAVNEANQRRARMTRRQQRNITVTSMLVSSFLIVRRWPR